MHPLLLVRETTAELKELKNQKDNYLIRFLALFSHTHLIALSPVSSNRETSSALIASTASVAV